MFKSNFKVSFYLRSNRINKEGKSPLLIRINLNGERMTVGTTGLFINPSLWNGTKNVVRGRTTDVLNTNLELSNITNALNAIYIRLEGTDDLSLDRIKQEYMGTTVTSDTILELFSKHNEDVKKQIGHGLSETSYQKYELCRKRFAEMLKRQYHRDDLKLSELTPFVIHDFELYLKTVVGHNSNTATKTLKTFKTIILFGKKMGVIHNDPFMNIRFHLAPVDRGYLTDEEIECIMQKSFSIRRLELVRDLFVFSCFTGLAYIDMVNLKPENIVTLNDTEWIKAHRKKTKTVINVVLLDIPKQLIAKYHDDPYRIDTLFPVISNQKINSYLKEIADVCGINKNLTFHLARHTFATMTLSKGVPIESVSKMLGHTNIKTTQIYARITDKKIENDMNELAGKLTAFNESANSAMLRTKDKK